MKNSTIDLEFSISNQKLVGNVLGNQIDSIAVSGGGAGGNRHGSPILKNKPDLTNVKSKRISKAVGKGKQKHGENVGIVKRMLNDALSPSPKLVLNDTCCSKTVEAIVRFQRSVGITPDGFIRPDGPTFQALLKKSSHYSFTQHTFSPTVITPQHVTHSSAGSTVVTYRGGPPPIGSYGLNVLPSNRISMIPKFKTDRTGLQIHSRGGVGSDGCIVVDNKTLRELITAVMKGGSRNAKLQVVR